MRESLVLVDVLPIHVKDVAAVLFYSKLFWWYTKPTRDLSFDDFLPPAGDTGEGRGDQC